MTTWFFGLVAYLALGIPFGCMAFAHAQRRYPGARKILFRSDQIGFFWVVLLWPIILLGAGEPAYARRLSSGWMWPWSLTAKLEAGILIHMKRVEFMGCWVVCPPGQEWDYLVDVDEGDRSGYKIRDIYVTPEYLEALPDFAGF